MGPVPSQTPSGVIAVPHDRAAVLDQEYEVGPVTIRPGGRRFTEYLRSEPFQLDGLTWCETWPVIAQGKWPGNMIETDPRYERLKTLSGQDANERVVAMWLHRTACLFSLATREAWQVRTAAVDQSTRPPTVPEDWPKPPMAFGDEPGLDPVPRALPEWVNGAWEKLEQDEKASRALSAWHQGLLLNPLFPSYAMVAYCGTIETIAESLVLKDLITVESAACDTCGNVPKVTARFWATVALVRSDEEIASLKKTVNPYKARSNTAHGSATYGIETMFGTMHMFIYTPPADGQAATMRMDEADATQVFMWRDVPTVREIAADLLYRTLATTT